MQLTTLTLLFSALLAVCLAAPANNNLERRQTYIITCIGGRCDDGSTPVPSVVPKPTTTTTRKPDPPKSSTKATPTPTPTPTSTHKPDPPKSSTKVTPTPTPTPTPSKTTLKSTPKSTVKPTKTSQGEVGPSSTACPVPLYYQCGGYYDGVPWTGCTKCVKGAKCVVQNEWYDQCVADE